MDASDHARELQGRGNRHNSIQTPTDREVCIVIGAAEVIELVLGQGANQ